MKKKVLLVNVCYSYPVVIEGIFTGINKIWQPLELALAKAMLAGKGVESRVLDSNALRISPEKTGNEAKGFDIVFVSTSSYDRWECPHIDLAPAVETVKSIRISNPDALIFLVGSHGTVRPKEMIKLTGCDAAVIGEPENVIVSISTAKNWQKTEGIAYLKEGKLVVNCAAKPVDLNKLPLPDFSDLPMKRYSFDMLGRDFAVVETSRGCPFQCFFCLKKMFGAYRRKNIENVKAEIIRLVNEYCVKNIFFLDLEFTLNKQFVEEICEFMIEKRLNIRWSCQTRLDTVDERLLARMKESGCKLIMYGVESSDDAMLERIGKNITVDDIRRGIRATRAAGIESVCFFMFGFPGETDRQREATVRLAVELDPDYASFFLTRPYPGTGCYDQARKNSPGLFPAGIGDEKELLRLKEFCDDAFGRFYYRPKKILDRLAKGDFQLIFNQVKLFLYKRGILDDA